MNNIEAVEILKRHHICQLHGCDMKELADRTPFAAAQRNPDGYWYCPVCRSEQDAINRDKIRQAKEVLGLG